MRQIATDQWVNWFNGLETVPPMLAELNLTAENFSGNNLMETVSRIQAAMAAGNAAYADAISVQAGWTFNLLITTLSLPKLFNGLMLLPILSAVSQIVMTKITGTSQGQPQDPNSPGASTGKFMTWFFPIFSLVICFGYSSAFALYWVAGNLVSMAQTIIINKVLDSKEQKATVAGEGSVR